MRPRARPRFIAHFPHCARRGSPRPHPIPYPPATILVAATIEGSSRPMQFILDSGAGETVLAKRAATELGLSLHRRRAHPNRRRRLKTPAAPPPPLIRLGSSVQIRSASPRARSLSILPANPRPSAPPIDGLLGADFFQGRIHQDRFQKLPPPPLARRKPSPQTPGFPLSRGVVARCLWN